MEINIRQLLVNIKDFDSNLEINKLSFKGVFSVSIHYIKYFLTKSSNRVPSLRKVLIVYVLEVIMMKIFFICFLII